MKPWQKLLIALSVVLSPLALAQGARKVLEANQLKLFGDGTTSENVDRGLVWRDSVDRWGITFNTSETGDPLKFKYQTTPLLTIESNGELGLGTTDPVDPLHIQDATQVVSNTQLTLESGFNGYGAGIDFVSRTSSGGTRKTMAKITADGESTWDTTAANQDAGLRIFTTLDGTTAERVRITAGGEIRATGSAVAITTELRGSTNAASMSGVSANSGRYLRTGQAVTVHGTATFTSGSGATGAICMTFIGAPDALTAVTPVCTPYASSITWPAATCSIVSGMGQNFAGNGHPYACLSCSRNNDTTLSVLAESQGDSGSLELTCNYITSEGI